MKSKFFPLWLGALITALLVNVVCLFLIIPGLVSLSLHGFGFDSVGRLYVADDSAVKRFDGDQWEDIIATNKHRFYAFAVTDQDALMVAGDGFVSYYDLDGALLDQYSDPDNEAYEKLRGTTSFSSSDGHTYEMTSHLGRYRIISDNGTIVYQMPLFDYGVKLLLIAGVSCLVLCVLSALYWSCLKEHKDGSQHFGI